MRCFTALAAALALALALAPDASAQSAAATGASAPQECTVANVQANACGPKLNGMPIIVKDGATASECGNVGDTGLVLAYVKRRHQEPGTEFRLSDERGRATIVEVPVRA